MHAVFVKTETRSWPKKALPSLERIRGARTGVILFPIRLLCNNAPFVIPAYPAGAWQLSILWWLLPFHDRWRQFVAGNGQNVPELFL